MRFFGNNDAEMRQVKAERDWLRVQYYDLVKELKEERKRNLKREDALLQQIVRAAGGQKLPLRFEEEVKTQDEPEPSGLSPADEQSLWQRAREYVEQKFDIETLTEGQMTEKVKEAFEMMKADPNHWLSD